MMPRKVLLLGATSAIAQETARLLAADGDRLFLVGRSADRLGVVAKDLELRGAAQVECLTADLDETSGHDAIVERAAASLSGIDTVILAYGIMGDQKECERDYSAAERVLRTNLLSAISLLTRVAERLEEAGTGTIVAISSPAGDRGRQSNYVYGASKGGLSVFLQGLRNRLYPRGVRVVTVKPGFVNTPMTAHLEQGPLFVQPAIVAGGIHRAITGGGDVRYLPWFWWPIMTVIRLVPEPLFKRLKL
jgi:decaprenylphospho-beta-D-erythro-pentofuranosid-2-ulose 2-reductase